MTRLLLLIVLLLPSIARAQVYVTPRRPGKSVVRHEPQEWMHVDLLVDEEIGGEKAGGVRLYFYEAERPAAERAAVWIEQAYRELCEELDYTPSHRFPYILYSTYQEFLRTNLFPMQEGVLGVTSPRSLEVTLPYFGDPEQFRHVSKHELTHQFTIQKLRDASKDNKEARFDPVGALPLWFIEGLAEYRAYGEIDPETEMRVRDLVVNPDLWSYHVLPDFYDDNPGSVLWTYKLGQARIAFLEETYGEGTANAILDRSVELVVWKSDNKREYTSFSELVEKTTGDSRFKVSAKFDTWIKRRVFPEWLDAEQAPDVVTPLTHINGIVGALDASPDGNILLYRSIEASTGRSRLYLVDGRAPGTQKRVVLDGVPGIESLHPVDGRNFDLGDGALVWVAESRGADVVYWQELAHEAKQGEERSKRAQRQDPGDDQWQVKLKLGPKRQFRLRPFGLVAAHSVSLSPDGRRVAFVGLRRDGTRDVYVLDPGDDFDNPRGSEGSGIPTRAAARQATVLRLTHDDYAERAVAWGPDGIVYSSDATEDGHFNLFELPELGAGFAKPARLTREARDHRAPAFMRDGRLLFVAWDGTSSDLQELVDGEVVKRTDVTIGVSEPAPGPDDDQWALLQLSGKVWPVRIPSWQPPEEPAADSAVDSPDVARAPDESDGQEPVPGDEGGPPYMLPSRPLDDAVPYQPLKPASWRFGDVFALVGAGGGAIFGQAYLTASDQLKDHSVVLASTVWGNFRLVDGYLIYYDESHRVTFGGGPFSSLRFRYDGMFADEGLDITLSDGVTTTDRFTSGERYYGGLLSVRYPIDHFVYLQLDQSVGAADYFLFSDEAAVLEDGDTNGTGRDLLAEWNDQRDALRLQTETTARVGIDTIGYHWATGPLTGGSAMIESTLGLQPGYDQVFNSVRLDLERYVAISRTSGANVGFRGSAGSSFGGELARAFYLSSYQTLRGVNFGDPDWLLGRNFWFTGAELQVPMQSVIAVAFLSTVEGVIGLDFGGVSDEMSGLWDKRVLDVALGGNLVIGPFVFKFHWARPIDVGAPLPDNGRTWVPNIYLTWLQL